MNNERTFLKVIGEELFSRDAQHPLQNLIVATRRFLGILIASVGGGSCLPRRGNGVRAALLFLLPSSLPHASGNLLSTKGGEHIL